MRASECYKTINGKRYNLWARDEKKYAKRTAELFREQGYLVRVLPDPRVKGQYEVWSTKPAGESVMAKRKGRK